MNPDYDSAMRSKEAGEYLAVCRSTLMRYVKNGRLKRYFTPGGHSRYLKSELDAIRANPPKAGRPRKEDSND
jgi:excisionase family DNA binding protein